MFCSRRSLRVAVAALLSVLPALAQQSSISPDLRSKIDQAASDVLVTTGVPSASIAVVKDGHIVYTQAYGKAKLDPATAAKPEMRYSVGSISKQFTATAILLLAEQGKLKLDDKVSRFVPNITRASEVTIRQLLSMTAGYQDFWPQDYVMPGMLKPTTAEQILDGWARKPLDFEPGTKWQYSNTNYVIAGMIVEKASGMKLLDFLQQRVFGKLDMKSIANTDAAKLPDSDPTGFIRYGIGPLHPAPKEGPGWMFAAGELAMSAEDLAKWDISMIDQTVLRPPSYAEMEREVLLNSGASSGYGLGVFVAANRGHRKISHGGEVSGFTAENDVFPDDHMAVAVLTNQDAAAASGLIADKISALLLQQSDPGSMEAEAQALKIFHGLQKGEIDRALFSGNANFYFDDIALKDFAATLGPLGEPQEFKQINKGLRGGMTLHSFRIKFPNKTLRAWTYTLPDGKLEQYQIAPVE